MSSRTGVVKIEVLDDGATVRVTNKMRGIDFKTSRFGLPRYVKTALSHRGVTFVSYEIDDESFSYTDLSDERW